MPTLSVSRDQLFLRLGKTYSEEEFDEVCFQFGVELDEVLTEKEAAAARQLRGDDITEAGSSDISDSVAVAGDGVLYYIAIPANRTDLLCLEGFACALNVFLGNAPLPDFRLDTSGTPGGVPLEMVVDVPSASRVRPYVVCAVLRGVRFTSASYRSFIDLQDRLHANICRRRSLVAIGTHDLDTLTPPFRYAAVPGADFSFVPLSQTRAFTGTALLDFYATDPSVKHIKPYVSLLAGAPALPLIRDAAGVVLSLPPLINGAHSAISLSTRNVFIECTATDLTKAHTVLNTVVAMFAEYAASADTVEPVRVRYEGGPPPSGAPSEGLTPDLRPRRTVARLATIRSVTGLPDLSAADAAALARRMQLAATPGRAAVPELSGVGASEEEVLLVDVPPTRADVLHECDIVEDVAIAYGYNRLARTVPAVACQGAQQPLNKLTDALRGELAACGFLETLTFALVSREENYAALRLADDGAAVELANPKTEDFQVGRTRLLPGLLKSLAANRARAAFAEGVRIFEVSDVMLNDAAEPVGARNERRLAALYSGTAAGFEVVHGLADRVMQLLEVPVKPYKWAVAAAAAHTAGATGADAAASYGRGGLRYTIEPEASLAMYLPGRGARLVVERADGTRTVLGSLGVLHPEVLKNFGLEYPCSAIEICIEIFAALSSAPA